MTAEAALGQMDRLHALVEDVERRGGEVAEASRALLRGVLELHEAGLARALELAAAHGEAGRALVAAMARDPVVASMLLLHGLHPEGIEARVSAALAGLEAALAKRGAAATLVAIADGDVRVELRGAVAAARALVEEALVAAAPDARSIAIDEVDTTHLLPAERLLSHGDRAGRP